VSIMLCESLTGHWVTYKQVTVSIGSILTCRVFHPVFILLTCRLEIIIIAPDLSGNKPFSARHERRDFDPSFFFDYPLEIHIS